MCFNRKYLFNNDWSYSLIEEYNKRHKAVLEPKIVTVDCGSMLPAIPDKEKPWGLGGVLQEDGTFVEESMLDDSFGGEYSIDDNPIYLDEDVLYIGIIPKHWGHFIIDVISKLWCIYDYKDLRIAYCGLDWKGEITGNYLELLKLAGIKEEQLLFVDRPYIARRVLIPTRTLGFREDYHPTYNRTIDVILYNVMAKAEELGLKKIDNIYFTRTKLKQARLTEVGEARIEKVFKDNGYSIISPEKLSVVEQIFYYNTAERIACVSGTIPHNIVFSSDGCNITIFNRTCVINPPQIRINQLKCAEFVYVDAFDKWVLNHPRTYGGRDHSPIWLEINKNVENYFKDLGFVIRENKLQRMIQHGVVDRAVFIFLLVRHEIKIFLVKTNLYAKLKRKRV